MRRLAFGHFGFLWVAAGADDQTFANGSAHTGGAGTAGVGSQSAFRRPCLEHVAKKLLVLSVVLAPKIATATTYYVSGTGSDTNSGLSPQLAFRNLQTAAYQTNPGDTVLVMDGTYTPPSAGADVLDVWTSGTANAWITYAAASGQHPIINFKNGWAGFQIDAAYIIVQGFEFVGDAKKISLAYAQAHDQDLDDYLTIADGIIVDNFINGTIPNHIIIQNNIVHDAPGAGIQTDYADYITIQHNILYDNAFWSPYGNSGISIWEMRDTDNNTGYKNFIENNVSCQNQQFVPTLDAGMITDGNGIIVDDNENTQTNNVEYGGRTYVANNIVSSNGGSGIHTYASQHVDIVNNTAWMNNQSPQINEGQIFADSSDDVNVLNSIGYAPPNKVFYTSSNNGNSVLYNFNLLFSTTVNDGLSGSPLGSNDLVADPSFVALADANVHLNPGSPAINSGTSTVAPLVDFDGNPRPTPNQGFDRGAYQYQTAGQGRQNEWKSWERFCKSGP